jgi:GntR family transcriptional regulator
VEVQVPTAEIVMRLRIPTGAPVVVRHQIRLIDSTPWSLQTSFYPMELVRAGADRLMMADDISGGTVRYLEQTLGLRQVGYRDWITARTPDQNEVSFFGIPHDAMVFEIFRTAFDQNGKPMRVTVTVFPTDRNRHTAAGGPP